MSNDDEWERQRAADADALERQLAKDREWFESLRRTSSRPVTSQLKPSETAAILFRVLGSMMLVVGLVVTPLTTGAFEVWYWLEHARWPNYQLKDFLPNVPTIEGVAGANQLLRWVWDLWLGISLGAGFSVGGLLLLLVASVLDDDLRVR